MRTMLRVTLDVEAGNQAIRSNTLGGLIENVLNRLKPEAAYFLADKGVRTALFVFEMKESADIPAIAEPFFTGVNATVEFIPVMNAEDLQTGLKRWAAQAK